MSKAAVRQKRGENLSRTSSLIEDTLKQVGKRQKLFMEEHVCTIFRITLAPSEQFSRITALAHIDKYKSKRQAHCTGRFLEDRMSLMSARISGKLPFRSWVAYREIESVFISKNKPQFFVLCINSETSNQRYYEIYKCKDSKKTLRVEKLLNCAFADPDKIIRDLKSVREVSCADLDRVRSLSTFELQRDPEHDQDEVNGIVNGEPSPVDEYDVPKTEAEPPFPEVETIIQQQHAEYNSREPTELSIENLKDAGEITYIAFHPTKGPVINDVGPIYMFSSTSSSRTYETREFDLDQPISTFEVQQQQDHPDYSQSSEISMTNIPKSSTLDLRNTDVAKPASLIDDDLEAEKSHSIKIQALKGSNVTSDAEDSVADSYTAERAVYNGYQAA